MCFDKDVESSISINNMLLNKQRLEAERKNSICNHGFSFLTINPIIKFFKILSHIKNSKKNGIKKTKILCNGEINKSSIQDFDWLHTISHNEELNYRFINRNRPKIAVYTAIFGEYDNINEPLFVGKTSDFYIVTDQHFISSSKWNKIKIPYEKIASLDGYHKAKWCKMHPHILFPDYDYSIWIDGNVQVVADMAPLIDRIKKEYCMATFQNPLHDCIYTEAQFCIYQNCVDTESMFKQINRYKAEGFPRHFGMREFSIIARKHNNIELIELMEEWWNEVNKYTMRDQISLPYLLWKKGKKIDYIQPLGCNWRYNPRFICESHNKKHVF